MNLLVINQTAATYLNATAQTKTSGGGEYIIVEVLRSRKTNQLNTHIGGFAFAL